MGRQRHAHRDGLLPGQRFETVYKITPNTSAVVVTLDNVTPGASQNQLFGDDILLSVHSAKTSSIGEGDYPVTAYTTGGTYTVPNPELGIIRVTVNGDWSNASPISARVSIRSEKASTPGQTAQGKIANGNLVAIAFTVPAAATQLNARLEWDGDWSSYPGNDIDLYLQAPDGSMNVDGATISDPETVTLASPAAGAWTAYVDGFDVETKNGDKYTLRIEVDGKVIKK